MLGTCGSGTDLYDFLQHFWNKNLENPCTHLGGSPVLNGIVFLTSPIYSLHEEGEKGLSIKELCSMKIFWVVMLMMTCAVCGFSVGIMWPGTLSIASASIRVEVTAMFALLALAGDLGCSGGPTLAGFVSSSVGNNLRRNSCGNRIPGAFTYGDLDM